MVTRERLELVDPDDDEPLALPHADIRKCYLTGGINASEEDIQIKLPKTQMASTLVALFDDGRMKLPKSSKEIEAMVEGLLNYELNVSEELLARYLYA
jgi:hypothetical protein